MMTDLRLPVLIAGIVVAGSTTAETYRFSNWNAPNEPTVVANQMFADDLARETDGAISFDFFSGGSVMPPKSHLQGVGDGVVQFGAATTGYTPTELPLTASLGGFGFIEPDPTTIGAAFADWMMHDPAAKAEWAAHNVVPLGGFATPAYSLVCKSPEPVTTLEQVQGLKIRTYGLIGTLVQDIGGVPVSIPSSEIYQALQTGAIDCASVGANFLTDANLVEVAKSVTLTEWTPAFNSPQMVINKDFWKGITEEQRAQIIALGARTHARAHILYNTSAASALEVAKEKGLTVVEPDASLKTALAEWIDNGVGDVAGVATKTYGVKNVDEVFASFEPYIEKWRGLIASMNDPQDEEELTAVFIANIYNDLDPASYGMN